MSYSIKRLSLEIGIALTALVAITAFMIPYFLEAQTLNTPRHFPDPVFRRHLEIVLGLEPGGRFHRKQLATIKKLDLTVFAGQEFQFEYTKEAPNDPQANTVGPAGRISRITNLTGIEYLGNLEEFYLYENRITQLDLSKNPKLRLVSVQYTRVQSLILANNPTLELLFCNNNQLAQLDLSQCPKLNRLECQYNALVSLDIAKCRELRYLDCHQNDLTRLDLSQNLALEYAILSHNRLTEMPDLRHHRKIDALDVEYNYFDHGDFLLIHALFDRFSPIEEPEDESHAYRFFHFVRQNGGSLNSYEE